MCKEVFKVRLHWALSNLVLVEGVPAHGRGLEPDELKSLFQPRPFYDSLPILYLCVCACMYTCNPETENF